MTGHADWRATIAITCSFAVVLVVVVWNMRKTSSSKSRKQGKSDEAKETEKIHENVKCQNNVHQEAVKECPRDDIIAELPDPKWVKVGQVQELYYYPLKSGRGKELTDCNFTAYGISVENNGRFTLRDRMFLVYNEETGRFQTGRQYPTLILVSLSVVDEFKVKLEAVGMPSVIFNVPKHSKNNAEAVECTMWWGESVKCIDCGPEPAEWLSRFLTGTNSGLRLGYSLVERRNIQIEPWEKFTNVYKTLRCEDTGLFSDLASYMLMTTQSLEKLNEKLDRPVPALQFRPNILVSGPNSFAEDKWEWLKIGEKTVIRNVKPCPRCKMVTIDPDTGVAEKNEPLQTLKSFREQTDPERISVDGKAPVMGIYCGLYISGKVKVGDDVYLHVPDDFTELNHEEAEDNSQPT